MPAVVMVAVFKNSRLVESNKQTSGGQVAISNLPDACSRIRSARGMAEIHVCHPAIHLAVKTFPGKQDNPPRRKVRMASDSRFAPFLALITF